MVPTAPLPPVTSFTFHVTAVFDVPCTDAVNGRVDLVRTDALAGDTETAIDGEADTPSIGAFSGTVVRAGLLSWKPREGPIVRRQPRAAPLDYTSGMNPPCKESTRFALVG